MCSVWGSHGFNEVRSVNADISFVDRRRRGGAVVKGNAFDHIARSDKQCTLGRVECERRGIGVVKCLCGRHIGKPITGCQVEATEHGRATTFIEQHKKFVGGRPHGKHTGEYGAVIGDGIHDRHRIKVNNGDLERVAVQINVGTTRVMVVCNVELLIAIVEGGTVRELKRRVNRVVADADALQHGRFLVEHHVEVVAIGGRFNIDRVHQACGAEDSRWRGGISICVGPACCRDHHHLARSGASARVDDAIYKCHRRDSRVVNSLTGSERLRCGGSRGEVDTGDTTRVNVPAEVQVVAIVNKRRQISLAPVGDNLLGSSPSILIPRPQRSSFCVGATSCNRDVGVPHVTFRGRFS